MAVSTDVRLTPAQVYAYARGAGLDRAAAITATAIAGSESRYRPGAVNRRHRDDSHGLWQINMLAHGTRFGTAAQLYDPATNADAMAALSQGGTNWYPWSDWKNGKYLAYMPEAQRAADQADQLAAGEIPPGAPPPPTEDDDGGGGGGVWGWIAENVPLPPQFPGLGGSTISDIPTSPGDVAGAVLDPLEAIGGIASALLDPAWWRRIGVGLLGAVLIVAGVVWLGRDLITDTIAGAAGDALTGGT